MNDSFFVVQNEKQFQNVEQSFLNIYLQNLTDFANRIYEQICKAKGMQPEEEIQRIAKWINTFARFNHWTFKTFMVIERNAMKAQGIKLYFEGVKILKEYVIDKIYEDLYRTLYQAL